MGIESDRLVYDYLSQVGDLAQQCGLPSRDRMRLVATLRAEIDQQRAAAGSGGRTEAGVKRILGRLGTPTEVVSEAGAQSAASAARAAYGAGPAEPPAYGTDRPGAGADHSGAGGPDAGAADPAPGGSGGTGSGANGAGPAASPAAASGARPTGGGAPGGGTPRAAGPAVPGARPAESEAPAPSAPGGPTGSAAQAPQAAVPGTSGTSDTSRTAATQPSGPQEAAARKLTRTARERLAGLAERSGLTGKAVPGPRTDSESTKDPAPDRPQGASPPHLAGEDELTIRESNPDWWRMDAGPFSQRGDTPFGAVEGFTGGIEIAELLKPPGSRDTAQDGTKDGVGQDGTGQAAGAGPDAAGNEGGGGRGARRGVLRRVLGRRAKAEGSGGGRGLSVGPMLAVSIVLLTAGALLGNVILLAFGWVIAYYLGKLSPGEAKMAVLVLPGLVAGGAMVWVWGRLDGRWGEPIPEHGLGGVVRGTWPVVVRAAAVVSVLFLIWRSRRRGQG
ncbi:hypothetical protein [Streptomyces palmae]|uniref:hypothetical protein n=1 Tax=Streptomyces palmae TaxID=1701085 RepID=UPI001AE067C9|nr:hypothetical protein [Streptomyces palmae]